MSKDIMNITTHKDDFFTENASILGHEFRWLAKVIQVRLGNFFGVDELPYSNIEDIPVPDLSGSDSPYVRIINELGFKEQERLIILLALAPHLVPNLLEAFIVKSKQTGDFFVEFGGMMGRQYRGFIPTGETASFLLGGRNLEKKMRVSFMFDPNDKHPILKIVHLEESLTNEPLLSGILKIKKEYLSRFTKGGEYLPRFSTEFPAEKIETKLEWDDLILNERTRYQVNKILIWLKYNDIALEKWGLGKRIKPGYRALFFGPPGTGKTLTASLLGKIMHKEVFRIDLSQVVSKYIGETEKNMANIFDQAEDKNWILFFDEADALFGKRVQSKSSNDQHSNQQIAYLLQRIEAYPGVILLATNLKGNIDDAFCRRFQSIIHFDMPNANQRYSLWKNTFSTKTVFDKHVDLRDIAREYTLAGGAILNIVHYCTLEALVRGENIVTYYDIIEGIRREFKKEGKVI